MKFGCSYTFMTRGLFLILATLLIIGCDSEEDLIINLSTEDKLIIEKAYSATYMYPDGFNYDTNIAGSPYYENTVSIRASQDSWIELSTNDKQQAKDWSEISSSTSDYYRDVVAERETDKYFEFKRVRSSNPGDIILSRVHKSSYFIPTYDRFNQTNKIGVLMVTLINKEAATHFIEYMWANYLIGSGGKILENTIVEYHNRIRYNLKSVYVTYGDFGICDVIAVNNFDFYIDKESGVVTFETSKVKELQGTCG